MLWERERKSRLGALWIFRALGRITSTTSRSSIRVCAKDCCLLTRVLPFAAALLSAEKCNRRPNWIRTWKHY